MLPTTLALVLLAALLALCFSPISLVPPLTRLRQLATNQAGMMFQRINRTDAEQIFSVVRNVQGSTLPAGGACCLETTTFDGVRVSKPSTATFSLFAGLAVQDIVDSAYGVVQLYGWKASALVINDTATAIAAGDVLIPVNAQNYLVRSGASDGKSGFVVAGSAFVTATTPAAAAKPVFIRGM